MEKHGGMRAVGKLSPRDCIPQKVSRKFPRLRRLLQAGKVRKSRLPQRAHVFLDPVRTR